MIPVAEPTFERTSEDEAAYERLRNLSTLLDDSIPVPGTDYRIGLDPILGLLPGVGDLPATGVSAYIVLEAARLGAPRETIVRMLFNLVLDATLGSIPVIGDVFDAAWKANVRNVALLESRTGEPAAAERDRRFMIALGVALVAILFVLSVGTFVVVTWAIRVLGAL